MMLRLVLVSVLTITFTNAFRLSSPSRRGMGMKMSSLDAPPDLNLAALPTVEEWLAVCDPQLQKVTTAMFRSVKEIAYKVSSNYRIIHNQSQNRTLIFVKGV